MLNLVLQKGPATVRAATANGLSSSASDEGGEPIEHVAVESTPAIAATNTTETERDTETDEAAVGGSPSADDGADNVTVRRSQSESIDAASVHADESVAPTLANTEEPEPSPQKSSAATTATTSAGGTAGNSPVTPPGDNDSPKISILTNKRGGLAGGGLDVNITDQAFKFAEHSPQPAGIFMAHLGGSGIPLPPTTTNIQYAACGGGLVINEKYHGLPLHTNDLANIRPHLAVFAKAYGLDIVRT